jgi:threonine dehydrogenase-like Zn-dependent dehydrogenase
MVSIDELVAAGEVGGRTVVISADGRVRYEIYPRPTVPADAVLVRTMRTGISPGTEMTFVGTDASNPYLHKRWNEGLRLFEPSSPTMEYPISFGYRAAGEVISSSSATVPVGSRVYGRWRHTEFVALSTLDAAARLLPTEVGWDDAIDLGQMAPICINAVAFGNGEQAGRPSLVFGAGVIGLITAQVVAAEGGDPVVLVDRLPQRLAIGRRLGCETVEAMTGVDVAATLKRRFGADAIAVAWECSGSYGALAESIRTVRRRGTVVAVGFYQGASDALRLGDEFHHNGIRVVAGQIGNLHPAWDRAALEARAIELLRTGRLVLGGLPRLTLPVEQAAAGFEALHRPAEVLQVALTYD